MSFQRASILNKIPRNYMKSFKTVDTRASGLHFITPLWAWSWPWGWYKKIPKMFIQRVGMLNKFSKFHSLGIKAVHARASGLHFPTPFCAWGRPWGWYQKMPIMFIQRAKTTFPKFKVEASKLCILRTPFSNTFLRLRLALRVVSENANNVYSEG